MNKLVDVEEIQQELSRYEFVMFNRANREGELTTLDEKDINDILYDMRRGVQVFRDEHNQIVVTYPHNVCKLESRGLIT